MLETKPILVSGNLWHFLLQGARTKKSDRSLDFFSVAFRVQSDPNSLNATGESVHRTHHRTRTRTFFSFTRHSAHVQCEHMTVGQVARCRKSASFSHLFRCRSLMSMLNFPYCSSSLLPRNPNIQRLPHRWQGVGAKAQAHALAGVPWPKG